MIAFLGLLIGYFYTAPVDDTVPSPPPVGVLVIRGTTITVTQSNNAEAGATRKLERRAFGTTDAWTAVATDSTPATNRTLVDSGVPGGTYEYEVADYDAAGNRTIRGSRWCGIVIGDTSTVVGQIKAAIVGRLVLVSGIDASTAHARIRDPLGKTDAEARTLWAFGGTINAWEVEREGAQVEWGAPNHGGHLEDTYICRGWYSFEDSSNSEATFAAHVEGAMQKLIGDRTLGGLVRDLDVALRVYGHAQKGGRLCHYAEIAVTCRWTLASA